MDDLPVYLTTLDSPFGSGDITVPGRPVLVAIDIPIHMFNKSIELASYFKGDGKDWWNDGMQQDVCQEVHVFTDNPGSGLFCGFSAMNDRRYFYLLGKLKMNDFAARIMTRLQQFLAARQ